MVDSIPASTDRSRDGALLAADGALRHESKSTDDRAVDDPIAFAGLPDIAHGPEARGRVGLDQRKSAPHGKIAMNLTRLGVSRYKYFAVHPNNENESFLV